MSQLRRAESSGRPEGDDKLSWAEFVQHVLGLTIKAYQAMRRDRVAERRWEENVFTLQLGYNYIRKIARDDESPVRVSVRPKIHTEQMRTGKQPTIEAKEIDLQMFDIWERDYHKKHFVWEAKRVGDKRVDGKYNGLNSEYVQEAIYRFIKREYADTLSDAGILGYVLGGNASNIVGDINLCMSRIRKNPPLPASNHLQIAHPINNFEDVYHSHHTRTDNTNICLYHLFLTFDFT